MVDKPHYFKNQPVLWVDPKSMTSGKYKILDSYININSEKKESDLIRISNGTLETKVSSSELKVITKEIKALTYKKDGNTIKTVKLKAEQINPHVYIANSNDNWGTFYDLYLDVNGIVFHKGNYSLEQLLDDNFILFMEFSAQNYLHEILTDETLYPRKLEIEIVRQLGFTDKIEMLQQRQQKILEKREQAEQQTELERKLREAQLEEQRYQCSINSFKEGKNITGKDFEDMLKRNNIAVHPRTLQNIQKYLNAVNSDGTIRVIDKKRDYSGIFDTIQKLRTKLNI